MSDAPSPAIPDGAGGDGQPSLSASELDTLLADFRAWLTPWTERPVTGNGATNTPAGPETRVDLSTLVGQFIALRQDVSLQTKAARAQSEQAGEAIRQLGSAVDELRATRESAPEDAQQAAREAEDAAVRPLFKAMLDAYDALALAGREVDRTAESLQVTEEDDFEDEPFPEPPEVPVETPSGLAAWLGARPTTGLAIAPWEAYTEELMERLQEERETRREREMSLRRASEVVRGLSSGYRMGLRRLERALEQAGVTAIPAVGQPFDPDRMEAVDTVADPERSAGEVVSEVRRGWLWRGRVFRVAQVLVVRG